MTTKSVTVPSDNRSRRLARPPPIVTAAQNARRAGRFRCRRSQANAAPSASPMAATNATNWIPSGRLPPSPRKAPRFSASWNRMSPPSHSTGGRPERSRVATSFDSRSAATVARTVERQSAPPAHPGHLGRLGLDVDQVDRQRAEVLDLDRLRLRRSRRSWPFSRPRRRRHRTRKRGRRPRALTARLRSMAGLLLGASLFRTRWPERPTRRQDAGRGQRR